MRRCLVTGGGGFLGQAIVRRLRERGDEVRVLARGRYPAVERLGAVSVQADLADQEAVRRACRGMDLVFHVAAKAGFWGPEAGYRAVNVEGTRHVLRACREEGVPRLVYTSTPSVVYPGGAVEGAREADLDYPARFECAYAATKAEAERMVLAAHGTGLATVALRPHLVFGPGDNHLIPRILARARQGRLFRVGDGTNRVDVTYVDCAAQAHLLAADCLGGEGAPGGRAYFLSQGEPVRLWEFLDRVLQEAGLPPVRRALPYPLARALGGALEGAYRLLRLPGEPRMTRFLASQLATSHWFDLSAARADLGYRPEVSTEEGLRRLGAWIREGATS